MVKNLFAQIALPIALPPLTYKIPEHLLGKTFVGMPVVVPLRKKKLSGYISKIEPDTGQEKAYAIKEIIEVATDLPELAPAYMTFLQWIADYYHYPIGEVIQSALPPSTKTKQSTSYSLAEKALQLSEEDTRDFSLRGGKRLKLIELFRAEGSLETIPMEFKSAFASLKKDGYITSEKQAIPAKFLHSEAFPNTNLAQALSQEQAHAFESVRRALDEKKYKAFLLQGVTGSGKTEVYLSAAEYSLAQGRGVLILVPEIALTPQLLGRVRSRLGTEVAVMHSALTDSERNGQWALIQSGRARVVLGARSTIFAPLKNIGLVIIDEEHETAFKQEDRLKYNARDMALLRASQEKAVVVLGSATPSLESFHHSISGKLERLILQKRFSGNALPKIEIVDLKREKIEGSISGRLGLQLQKTLDRGKQSILFLNRRGFASFRICQSCGDVPECPNCSVSLTHYKRNNSLQCHYCAYEMPSAPRCTVCNSDAISFGGLGTESLEIELRARFPSARIVRVDRETTKVRGDLEKKLRAIGNNEYDFIIGTQMIAKGHDFPNIELAAIVNADVTLNVPDFRSPERAYQLFTQVAGRAGRGGWTGTVLLQTYDPENPAIISAKNNSYEDFARNELESRLAFHYPPYYRLVRIVISDASDERASAMATKIMQSIAGLASEDFEAIGPAPAVLHKILNRYRWNILLKSKRAPILNSILKTWVPVWKKGQASSTNISIDVDPVSLM